MIPVGPRLVSKANTTSKVWRYFGLTLEGSGKPKNSNLPVCRICFTEVSAKWGNTSNLFTHLQKKHPDKYLEVRPIKLNSTATSTASTKEGQQTMEQCVARSQMISTSSTEHKKLTRAVTRFLAKDMLPPYAVDKSGFREMIKTINPRYQLPHKDYFSRFAISSLYAEVHTDVEKKITSSRFYYSATTDLWSSCTTEPYLSYTLHVIDDEWSLQSYCLQANFMPVSHTGENLQDALSSTIQDWNLDETRQVVITTDNASNIRLACQLLKWRQLTCFGHNLDLAVRKGLSDHRVDRVLHLSRQIVTAFSSSWKRTKSLADIQQQKGLPLKNLKYQHVGVPSHL